MLLSPSFCLRLAENDFKRCYVLSRSTSRFHFPRTLEGCCLATRIFEWQSTESCFIFIEHPVSITSRRSDYGLSHLGHLMAVSRVSEVCNCCTAPLSATTRWTMCFCMTVSSRPADQAYVDGITLQLSRRRPGGEEHHQPTAAVPNDKCRLQFQFLSKLRFSSNEFRGGMDCSRIVADCWIVTDCVPHLEGLQER